MLLAASLERAVRDAAELLLGAGAVLALVWTLLRSRIGLLRWPLLVCVVGLLGAGTALGAWAWHENRTRTVRGSPTVEFSPSLKPPTERRRPRKELREEPWPMYGYDAQRTHFAPFHLRPPYEGLWRFKTPGVLEPPPVISHGRIFFAYQHGGVFAIDARSGQLLWKRRFRNCTASSAVVAGGLVYQPFMHRLPCAKHQAGARGFIAALDAKTGKTRWRFDAGAVESSPLMVGHILYFGSWDRKVYAVDVRRRRVLWSFETDDRITAAPAYAARTVYVATDGGRVYALGARSGRLRWRAESFSRFGRREYFYATPTVAYGRVFAGNTDGTVYAYGARTGRLLWARRAGTYVYAAPAVWNRTVYVGTWDGYFTALNAATGDVRWRFDSPGGIMGAPTVMAGLVYFSTFGVFSQSHLRRVEDGRRATFALNAQTGKVVWKFPDGHYSPIVADSRRIYLEGGQTLYAFIPRSRWLQLEKWRDEAKRAKKRRAGRKSKPRTSKSSTRGPGAS